MRKKLIKLNKDCDNTEVSVKLIQDFKLEDYTFCYYKYKREDGSTWCMLVEYVTGTPLGFDYCYPAIMALLCLLHYQKDKLMLILNKYEKINLKK